MIVWPGLRRSVSAISRLFNSASFYAPLTHSLVLDRGTGSPTFTRATAATVLGYGPTANSGDSQTLLTVAANEARFVGARRISEGVWSDTFADGTPIPSSTLLGYLAEGARTNLCLQSNAFTTTWTDISSGATQNVIGPDGATSAWTLTDNSAVAAEGIYQNITLTAAAYTWSVFVKKTTGATTFPLMYVSTGTTAALSTLDTNNGVATAWTSITGGTILAGVSARCSSYNATYWRFELTYTATAAVYFHQLNIASATSATYAGPTIDVTATGSAVFYGAQVELGSFATSYIPTTTLAVARNADVLTYSSAGNILGTVGAAYADVFRSALIDSSGHSILCNGSVNRSFMVMRSTTALLGYYDGTNDISSNAPAITSGTVNKVAISYSGSEAQTAVRGTASSSAAFDGNFNVDSSIEIGNNGSGTGAEFYGNIRNVRIWQRALSSSELQAITS